MSGDHRRHLGDGMDCADCHETVTTDSHSIAAPGLHIDGAVAISFSDPGISWNPGSRRCSGSCHGEGHSSDGW